jgi:hypothetical protein
MRFRKPSPAMAIAFIALLAALSGTAVALPGKNTVDSGDIKNNSVRSKDLRNNNVATKDVKNNNLRSADIRNNSLTGTDINEGSLGQVPSANTANNATSATNATTAANAQSLGGIPASGYTRNDCSSTTGQLKGFALVPGSAAMSTAFTNVSGAYNCSGQAVQARRLSLGRYEVQFLGSPVTIATGSIVNSAGTFDNAFVSFTRLAPGHFHVLIYNAVIASGQDRPFSVLTP